MTVVDKGFEKPNELYKQCEFKNENEKTTAWIQSKYAIVGKTGKFKDIGDGKRWEIVSVGSELPKNQIERKNETFISNSHDVNKMRGNK